MNIHRLLLASIHQIVLQLVVPSGQIKMKIEVEVFVVQRVVRMETISYQVLHSCNIWMSLLVK
jgi:hypothetical protein